MPHTTTLICGHTLRFWANLQRLRQSPLYQRLPYKGFAKQLLLARWYNRTKS